MRALIRIGAVLAALFVSVDSAAPQQTEQPSTNLYSMALFASLAEMQKQWGHFKDNTQQADFHNMAVEADADITTGLPGDQNDFHVAYLDTKGQIDRYKKLRKPFALMKIHPIKVEGSKLTIMISVSYFEYRHRRAMYGFSDWSEVAFEFDCSKNNYAIASIKLGGI